MKRFIKFIKSYINAHHRWATYHTWRATMTDKQPLAERARSQITAETAYGVLEFVQYAPHGHEPATDVRSALVNTKGVLEQEGRWSKGSWFLNDHPEVDPEDPFCNSWSACLEGIIGLVTIGASRGRVVDAEGWRFRDGLANGYVAGESGVPNHQLYNDVRRHVRKGLSSVPASGPECGMADCTECEERVLEFNSIPNFNDDSRVKRSDVIGVIDRAINALDEENAND